MISRFLSSCYRDHRHLHSFPTRRSSDLACSVDSMASSMWFPPLDEQIQDHGDHSRYPGCDHHAPSGLCRIDRKSTRLNSSHVRISYAVFCLKKKKLQ